MNNDNFRPMFHGFVCFSLMTLLGLQAVYYLWPQGDALESGFSDIKFVLLQLTRGLTEVDRKHQVLKTEIERISSALPAVASAADRAKAALQPASRCCSANAIDVRDYDRQIADYALESAGARVVDVNAVEHILYESPVSYALHVLSSWVCRECLGARAMLRPGALPGECWAFKGSRAEATIRLLGTVQVTGLSLEHIPPHISPTREISSAPQLFQLEGLEYRDDQYPHDFGSYEYEKEGKPIQYFEVRYPSTKGYNLVRLRIMSNWGHPVYTCVYRLRVHGDLVLGQIPNVNDDDLRIENE